MKIRTDVLALCATILAIVAGVILIVAKVSPLWLIIPGVILGLSVIALFVAKQKNNEVIPEMQEAEEDDEEPKWLLVVAWVLTVLTALAIIVTAIFAGWWSLIPAIAFCGALAWLLWLYEKKLFWIPLVLGLVALILLGVFAMRPALVNVDTLNVDTLNVTDANLENADVENADVENADVENADIENAVVNNQQVENAFVNNESVKNQVVSEQHVQNQEVSEQRVQNQTVENTKAPETTKPQETTKPAPETTKPQETTKPAPETTKPQETTKPAHKHSYTSKVIAPTCTSQGYTLYTCNCGDSYKDAYKAAKGHNYTSKVVAPTTDAKGYTLHTCSTCGHQYKDDYTDKLVVTPKFTLVSSGDGYWVVDYQGMSSTNLSLDWTSKGHIEYIDSNTVKVVKDCEGTCYFSLTDDASGEVIYLR